MIALLESVAAAWWSWVQPAAMHAAVLAVALWALDAVWLRRGWPRLRLVLWALVPLRLLAPPGVTSPVSMLPVAAQVGGPASDPGSAVAAASTSLPTLLFAGWWAGVVVVLCARWRRHARVRAELARGDSAPAWLESLVRGGRARLGLRRPVRIRLVSDLMSPAVFGVRRPALLIPAGLLSSFDRKDVEHVVLHELAHVHRGDLLLHALLRWMRVLFWFHPLLPLAARRLSLCTEVLCDQCVARLAGAEAYRRTLVRVAAARLLPRPAAGVPLLRASSDVMVRLRTLRRPPGAQRRLQAFLPIPAATLLALFLLPASARPEDAAPRDPTAQSEPEEVRQARETLARHADGAPGCVPARLAGLRLLREYPELVARSGAE